MVNPNDSRCHEVNDIGGGAYYCVGHACLFTDYDGVKLLHGWICPELRAAKEKLP